MCGINFRETRILTALFLLGTVIVIGGTTENASRSWLSLVISLVLAVPLIGLWLWILSKFPGRDLVGVLGELFGKAGCKLIAGAIGLYAFVTASWTLGNYTSFITMLSSRDTDKEILGMLVAAAAAVLAAMGMKVITGTAKIFFTFLLLALAVTMPLSIISVDPAAFPLPLFGYDERGVFEGALSLAMMPFGEIVILLLVLPVSADGKRNRGILLGAVTAFFVMLSVFLRNVLMLGERSMDCLYFHSFYALRILGIGSFFQRMEILISAVYMCSDLIRIALCILCCAKAAAVCFECREDKISCGPWAVAAFAVSEMVLINGQAVFVFRELCKYIALPFCIGIPVLCGIVLFFKKNKQFDGKFPLKFRG